MTTHFIDAHWAAHHDRWSDRLVTRFPPEPNGHLHLGHAKAMVVNFSMAERYGGRCHLRLDDTNPAKEDPAFAEGILAMTEWLGYRWDGPVRHASDHFEALYAAALSLIDRGLAYVDTSDAETVRARRGTLTLPGVDSPDRALPTSHHRALFERMRAGEVPEGGAVLRAKIDMASPNLNLRDPVLYRIKHVAHDRTGSTWPIYPSYDFAHPFCDAREGIALSLCTLEFEDHRPLYDWVIAHCAAFFTEAGASAPPEELEFARLELDRGITSKRKMADAIARGAVDGWDDPRLVTLLALKRRGFTPSSIVAFCERIGVSRANSTIPFEWLEDALRTELDPTAERRSIVVDPVRLTVAEAGPLVMHEAPNHPKDATRGTRPFAVGPTWWVSRDDVRAAGDAEAGFKRLTPGAVVRLMHGYVVSVEAVSTDADGRVTEVHATRTDAAKPRATIHAVEATTARPLTVVEVETWAGDATDPAACWVERSAMAEPALWADAPGMAAHALRYGYGGWDPKAPVDAPRWLRSVGLKSGFSARETARSGA